LQTFINKIFIYISNKRYYLHELLHLWDHHLNNEHILNAVCAYEPTFKYININIPIFISQQFAVCLIKTSHVHWKLKANNNFTDHKSSEVGLSGWVMGSWKWVVFPQLNLGPVQFHFTQLCLDHQSKWNRLENCN